MFECGARTHDDRVSDPPAALWSVAVDGEINPHPRIRAVEVAIKLLAIEGGEDPARTRSERTTWVTGTLREGPSLVFDCALLLGAHGWIDEEDDVKRGRDAARAGLLPSGSLEGRPGEKEPGDGS
jgi:hypothetical protein